MFKKKPDPGPPPALLARAKAIAARPAPGVYSEIASREERELRSQVFRQAIATLEGGERLEVAIKNLSSTGCRIEYFRQTPLTPTLIIDESSIPLHFQAEVVWQGDGAAGLRVASAAEE